MDQYIKTVISVGGSAIMLVMIVCVIWCCKRYLERY